MRPRQFEFHSPASIEDALVLAEKHEDSFMFYAGGTEAIIGLKERVISVDHVINLKKIPNLKKIWVEDGELHIGPLVTHQQIADSALVNELLPSYAALSANVANIRVRCAGTLAGNLCFAEPNADPPAMLAALDARVVLVSAQEQRQVPVREFFEGPYCTVREDGEFLAKILIPLPATGSNSIYQKNVYLNRPSAGVAVVRSTMINESQSEWEIWAGALTGMPERFHHLISYLNDGGVVDKEKLLKIANQDTADWDVLDGVYGSVEYRKHLTTVLAVRSVMECV